MIKLDQIKKPLLLDGAMGTLLITKGFSEKKDLSELNITEANLITSFHKKYVEAGSQIIYTHTFSANPLALKHFGKTSLFEDINRHAVRNAKAAADNKALVAGNMGAMIHWAKKNKTNTTAEELSEHYFKQASVLIQEGVDLLVIETITVFEDLIASLAGCLAALKKQIPIIISFTPNDLGQLADNTAFDTWLHTVLSQKSNIGLGLNCITYSTQTRDLVLKITNNFNRLVFFKPNAGLPVLQTNQWGYPGTPKEFCKDMKNLIDLPLAAIGGCCGTTPEHIKELSTII